MPNLIDLKTQSRYLRNIQKGAKQGASQDEITDAEEMADYYIEGYLSVEFKDPNIPVLISKIADKIASAHLLSFVTDADLEDAGKRPKSLMDQADKMLEKIKNGDIALKMSDGSFHPDFKGSSENPSEDNDEDRVSIIS